MPSRFAVNASILFGALPVSEALARIRAAGFSAVEFWWPFASADPDAREVTAFLSAVEASGLDLVGINLFGGDMAAGDRGVLSLPGHQDQFRASVAVARRLAEETGCGNFNALYGRRRGEVDPADEEARVLANLEFATEQLKPAGGNAVLEALSGFDDYPLKMARDVADVIEKLDGRGVDVGMQLDVYHHWSNGDQVAQVIEDFAPRIAHVQLADGPGRGAPGSGELPLQDWIDRLAAVGYDGRIALEFVGDGEDPFTALGEEWR